ncbi:MAG: nitroreductase family protein [Deltaproteobacteria bacterium]|nr:nitroreductase family protein [Deltaproteobacteria bacterium]
MPLDVVEQCIEIALQAPTGSNSQGWHFVVVTDAAKRKAIGDLYAKGFQMYRNMNLDPPQLREGDPRRDQTLRIIDSASYLAERLHEAPVHIIPCVEGRIENAPVIGQASVYGSILPSVWSLMLALRSRGLGSAWTTLHLIFEREVAQLLGIPDKFTQTALLPVAYFTGTDFKPAKRLPIETFVSYDNWGNKR